MQPSAYVIRTTTLIFAQIALYTSPGQKLRFFKKLEAQG